MTEEQLKEIERRWESNEVTMQTINDFNLLLSEVRKLNRIVDKACDVMATNHEGPCDYYDVNDSMCEPAGEGMAVDCANDIAVTARCWRKYLESEVADNG